MLVGLIVKAKKNKSLFDLLQNIRCNYSIINNYTNYTTIFIKYLPTLMSVSINIMRDFVNPVVHYSLNNGY